MSAPQRVVAREDASLAARVVRASPMFYADGADASLDRPAHVRAGSAIAWVGGRLAVVQDDANFLALVDPYTALAAAVPLPAGPGGRRQFDDTRGNKAAKLDLEAMVRVPADGGSPLLLALGSGSSARRETAVVLRLTDAAPEQGSVELHAVHALTAFYARLRETTGFAGSELNVEGATFLGSAGAGRLRLFNRGNGAPRDGRSPVDATCDVNWRSLAAHLARPHDTDAPTPFAVVQYDLGEIGSLPLTFTDAAVASTPIGGAPGDAGIVHTVYTAAAEASPDATRDGPVAGCALGVISEGPSGIEARWARLRDATGVPFDAKVEGVALGADDPTRAFVVVDRDAADVPSALCEVVLDGPWFPA